MSQTSLPNRQDPKLPRSNTELTEKISARLPDRLVRKLNETARKYRQTRQQIIRICCEDWLVEREGYNRR